MIARRWQRARAGVVALLLALTSACAVRAGAAEPDYLALGDSITFGSHPAPPAEFADLSNFHSYADDTARKYGLTLVNAACPGETAASMIDTQAQSHGCENNIGKHSGFRQHHALHTWYDSSQLSFAVRFLQTHHGVKLVSLGIGLNDLFVCRDLHPGCSGAALTAFTRGLTLHLDTILDALRVRAGYHGPLVLLRYYATQYPDAQVAALNAIITAAAKRHGALVADGYRAFADASAGTGGSACAAHLLAIRPDGRCDLHPSRAGQAVLAGAVEQALGRRR